MLLYYLFWMFMGFTLHFYIISGTNLLTGCPARIAIILPIQCFKEKEYQTESKRNETFGSVIFGKNMIRETWISRQRSLEEATRVGGAPSPWARPLSCGPLEHPPTDFFHLYISIYPKTSGSTIDREFCRQKPP